MTTDSAIAVFLATALGFGLKEVVSFIIKAKLDVHRDTILRLLNIELWVVFASLFLIVSVVVYAFAIFANDQPATKKDLLLGLSMALTLIFLVYNLGDDVIRWGKRYRELTDAAAESAAKSKGCGSS